MLNGTHLFSISSSTVPLGQLQPSLVCPEQVGYGSLQVATQSGASNEYTWPLIGHSVGVMMQTENLHKAITKITCST